MDKTYALYCNGTFVMARPFFSLPQSPRDFGVGEIPTSSYNIWEVDISGKTNVAYIPATIDVG